MQGILVALWPLFVLILMGYGMRRLDFPGQGFWPGAERFNYFVLFPALLFTSLASAPLSNPALPRLLGAVLLVLSLCVAGLYAARLWRKWPASRFGVLLQGLLRFNTYLGIAAVSSLYGKEGMLIATVVIALLVPMVNVLSVLALSNPADRTLASLLKPIATNPLIVSCVAGVVLNLSGVELKWGVDRLLTLLANTSLPLGLLSVGAALRIDELRGHLGAMLGNSLVRLLLVAARRVALCASLDAARRRNRRAGPVLRVADGTDRLRPHAAARRRQPSHGRDHHLADDAVGGHAAGGGGGGRDVIAGMCRPV